MSIQRYYDQWLQKADDLFYQGDYHRALREYTLLLAAYPNAKEARIGVLLSDIGLENDENAQLFFQEYHALKSGGHEAPEMVIEDMVASMDDTIDSINEMIEEITHDEEVSEGIDYADFKKLVIQRGSFRRAFEDIIFSTKVIITDKDDLLDFINRLIENGFSEMAIRYIEGAAIAFPGEERIRELAEKMKE